MESALFVLEKLKEDKEKTVCMHQRNERRAWAWCHDMVKTGVTNLIGDAMLWVALSESELPGNGDKT